MRQLGAFGVGLRGWGLSSRGWDIEFDFRVCTSKDYRTLNNTYCNHSMWIVYNVMIFDWSGLKEHRYFIINQKSDPLKYCNYPLPIPMAVGLPFMPCDLPNEYELISTDDRYEE